MSHRTHVISCSLACAIVVALASNAPASVVDMRSAVALESSLSAHYTFEGSTITERAEDKKNSYDLTPTSFGSGSTASIAFVQGFDSTSDAFVPDYGGNTSNGAGLRRSTADFLLPASGFTVEVLVSPGHLNSGQGYVLAGPGSPNRAYPLLQRDADLKLAAGSASFSDGAALRDVVSLYNEDDWYYVAVNYQISGSDTVVNSYVANLTAGDTTLTQTLTNEVITGTYVTGGTALGVGMFTSEAFSGAIDEMAIYSSLISAATLQRHLDLLLVPEPSSMVLLVGLGAVGLVGLVGRRRRSQTPRD